jgi:hypothetical protein
MYSLTEHLRNESGSTMAVVMMILALLTLVGISAISTTNTEQHIATSEQIHKMAFYAAEAGRGYVSRNSDLYYDDNFTLGQSLSFPDTTDAAVKYDLSALESFNGTVEYIGSSLPPRGSGFEAGLFRAHRYQMTSNGWGPRNSASRVEAGFYRIGF